jgi:glycosyltransferase involved in cell wall biosynthesis
MNISIVIPAYNEAKNLEDLVKQIENSFSKSKYSHVYEIVIINDGSTDNSDEIGEKICNQFQKITFINLKENISKAYSLDTGIHYAKGKIIATMDADLQYNPKDLIKMIDLICSGYDLVNGKREKRQDNFITKFFSRIYNFFLRFTFNVKLDDFFSGIKVFKREIYDLMEFSGLSRFVIFFSKKYNYQIKEVSIEHSARKKGKTSYSFIDRVILSIKDIFTLAICIVLEKRGIYQIKQSILSIFLILTIGFIIDEIFFKSFNNYFLTFLIASFFIFTILNIIIQNFLKSKERDSFNLKKNIKTMEISKI